MNEIITKVLDQPQYVPYKSKIKAIINIEIETTKTTPDETTITQIAEDVIFTIKKNKKTKSLRPPQNNPPPERIFKSPKLLDIDDQALLRLLKLK